MAVKDYMDPRWQKVRLRILERDSFQCQVCGATKDTLHVHHRVYQKKKKIWEAFDDDLTTLCEKCHERCESIVFWTRVYADRFLQRMTPLRGKDEHIPPSPIEALLIAEFFKPTKGNPNHWLDLDAELRGFFADAAQKAFSFMEEHGE